MVWPFKRCKGLKPNGRRCRKTVAAGNGYCSHHSSQNPGANVPHNFSNSLSTPPSDSPTAEPPLDPPAIGGLGNNGLGNSSSNLSLRIKKQSTEEPPANVRESSQHANVGESSQYADVQSTEEPEKGNISNNPATPTKVASQSPAHSTPFNAVSSSSIYDKARVSMLSMTANLAHRSYISSRLLDTFLERTPEVTQKHADDLHKKNEWNAFIATCTGGKKDNLQSSSISNEKEFRMLVQCIVSLEGLTEYFKKPQGNTQNEPEINNPRRGYVRISHQGNIPMTTWNTNARWLHGYSGSTKRGMELKPDLMTVVVEDAGPESIQLAKPQTILPPPDDWKPAQMSDKDFPIAKCREPVWECLDLFWECKRSSQELNNAEAYLSCALKAAEALRYQWSRRYVYCFLHCGSMMQLLHFDRSGLVASEALDIEKDTVKFIRCLLGAFCHEPSRLGYPAGQEAPFHRHDSDNKLRQVVTVSGRQLYIDDQEAGPPRDHLVSRGTVAFKSKLVEPKAGEKTGWDWCYKSSWPQKLRTHEGDYLERLQGLPNVVDLLLYGVVKIGNDNDDTSFGRGKCSSGEPMTLLNAYYRNNIRTTQRTGTTTSAHGDLKAMPPDPRQPESGSEQACDNREHRDVVTGWVNSSFDEAISSLDSLSTIFSIWEQAFSAIKAITEKGIVHRDISFRNIRIDDQHKLKVCDFDMAMSLDGQSTGAQDRIGTIAFMASSILRPRAYAHRPIHDCESIFWLCALELLPRVDVETIRWTLANINGGKDLTAVADSKVALVARLTRFKRKGSWPNPLHPLGKPNDSSLFFCLTALMREFDDNHFANDYQGAKDGFEDRCFDRCIEIIRGEFVAGGFAGMSLSDKGKGKGRD